MAHGIHDFYEFIIFKTVQSDLFFFVEISLMEANSIYDQTLGTTYFNISELTLGHEATKTFIFNRVGCILLQWSFLIVYLITVLTYDYVSIPKKVRWSWNTIAFKCLYQL